MKPPRPNARRGLAAVVILAAAAGLAFGPYLDGPFLFDDLHTIRDNPALRQLNPLHFLQRPESASLLPGTMVRPLLTFSYALDFHRAGADPRAFRLTNIVLHLLNALLVVGLTRRTRLKNLAPHAGLLFLLLPLAAVQVAYLSNRSVLLSAAFYLAGLLAFAAGLDRSLPRRTAIAAAAILFVLGLLTKASAATLPAAVLLWGLLFGVDDRKQKNRFTAIAALLLLALFAGYLLFRQIEAAPTFFPPARPWPVWAYAAAEARVFFTYLRFLAFPVNLALEHETWMPETAGDLLSASFLLTAAALVALLAAAVKARRAAPELAFAALFALLYLLPTNSVVPLVMLVNENRPYLSALILVWPILALADLIATTRPRAAHGLLLALALLFLLLTRARAADFATTRAVWRQAVAVAPGLDRPHQNLGLAELEYGRLDQARDQFQQALDRNPCADSALTNLGNIAYRQGRSLEAEALYRRALDCDPVSLNPRLNLFDLLLETDRNDLAQPILRDALNYWPNNSLVLGRMGEWYARAGQPEPAADFLRRAADNASSPAEAERWLESLRRLGGP